MYRLTVSLILILLLIVGNARAVKRTEAQRYYDLAVSLIKSDLYVDGLKQLNEVAFLYPDSDVADDALYQLALIRERVGNGELDIAQQESLEAQRDILKGITGNLGQDIVVSIMAAIAGDLVFEREKEKAITQYLLALDYLHTLMERYPDSDRMEESKITFGRIVSKIDALVPKPEPPARPKNAKRDLIIIGISFGSVIAIGMLAIVLGKIFGFDDR